MAKSFICCFSVPNPNATFVRYFFVVPGRGISLLEKWPTKACRLMESSESLKKSLHVERHWQTLLLDQPSGHGEDHPASANISRTEIYFSSYLTL
jgi:hypothetical protein